MSQFWENSDDKGGSTDWPEFIESWLIQIQIWFRFKLINSEQPLILTKSGKF